MESQGIKTIGHKALTISPNIANLKGLGTVFFEVITSETKSLRKM